LLQLCVITVLTSNRLVTCTSSMDTDSIYKALADSTRRLILDEFNERKEQTLYELSAHLVMKHNVTMSRPAIAKHIGILEDAGLLKSEHRGKYRVLILSNKPTIQLTNNKSGNESSRVKIILTSIFVDDQEKALDFYTKKLDFVKKHDTPLGEHRWLTIVSADEQNGTELLLEPSDNPTIQEYKRGLMAQGIPAAMFGISNLDVEYERLKMLDVEFAMHPAQMGEVKIALFDDTCGNLIQIIERRENKSM
jgi:DNA-binding transcriptional ArsR family regulator